jgi:hypothetical protein
LYLVILTGVSIGLRGLFHGLDGFDSNANTVLTLFSITFSVFDFTSFSTSSNIVNVIGILVLVGVLIMIPIILINLIIAQMTNSYQAVKDNAMREWGFSKARLVKQYVRRQEKSVLSGIPGPFNLLSISFGLIFFLVNLLRYWESPKTDSPNSNFNQSTKMKEIILFRTFTMTLRSVDYLFFLLFYAPYI